MPCQEAHPLVDAQPHENAMGTILDRALAVPLVQLRPGLQQGYGEVFVGSWADSFFGARSPLPLPVALFNDYQNDQSAMLAALPGLRPGASINQGERITQVTLTGDKMAIRWKT